MSIKLVRELLPNSQQWFIDKGYAIRCEEDGFLALKLTKAGEEYFASIAPQGETNGKDNQGN